MSRYISYENMDGMHEKLILNPHDETPQSLFDIKKILIEKLGIDTTDQTPESAKTPEELLDEALDNANIAPSSIKLVIN